jgi:putative transposase
MVIAVREGRSLRQVAAQFGVSLCTVQRWLNRAGHQCLSDVDFSDRPGGCPWPANRTAKAVEDRVLVLRRGLRDDSPLGEYGAAAIQRALLADGGSEGPSLRTIGRILERRGALDGRRRVRRPAPPKGWYLPEVAAGKAELDSFDIVEGLVIRGGIDVEVLNAISLHGGLCQSWPESIITAKIAVNRLLEHWRQVGLPCYAQFDNDTVFQGPHQWPDCFGRVTRLCLSLGIVPVFTPPRETGFQAMIENYNGRWQAKVWSRFEHTGLSGLQARSQAYVTAARQRAPARIEAAPRRRRFPSRWIFDLHVPLRGRLMYLRRSTASGDVMVLGHRYRVSNFWLNRLVRAEVDLTVGRVEFFSLRRRDPTCQRSLAAFDYQTPKGSLHD